MQFNFVGRDTSGQKIEGELQARSLDAALSELKSRRILPIQVEPGKKQSRTHIDVTRWFQAKKISLDDLILFCRQMSALMRAGIPLLRAISGLAETAKNPHMSDVLKEVLDSLTAGTDLAGSLSRHSEFSPLFVSIIRMGETTGRLDLAFDQLTRHLELEKDTIKRVKTATRYPIMVIVAISVALGVINWLVIPSFANVFSSMGTDLPFATKILITTSNFSVNYWWLILFVVAGGYYGSRYYVQTSQGRMQWDRYKLKIPLIGHILERITLGRFTRPFAMMLDAGVPMLQALKIASQTIGNVWIGSHIESMSSNIERGESLLTTAAQTGMFSPLLLQMLAVGEETGNVSEMLYDISNFYEQEVDYDLKKLSESIEPILLFFMGIMVLVLALGVFLPMWDLSSAANP